MCNFFTYSYSSSPIFLVFFSLSNWPYFWHPKMLLITSNTYPLWFAVRAWYPNPSKWLWINICDSLCPLPNPGVGGVCLSYLVMVLSCPVLALLSANECRRVKEPGRFWPLFGSRKAVCDTEPSSGRIGEVVFRHLAPTPPQIAGKAQWTLSIPPYHSKVSHDDSTHLIFVDWMVGSGLYHCFYCLCLSSVSSFILGIMF